MSSGPEVPGVVHDRVTMNGITLHVAQAGPFDGDPVILLNHLSGRARGPQRRLRNGCCSEIRSSFALVLHDRRML